jgi:hypothetical protein
MLAACRRRVVNEDYRRRSSAWSEKAATAATVPITNKMMSHTGQAQAERLDGGAHRPAVAAVAVHDGRQALLLYDHCEGLDQPADEAHRGGVGGEVLLMPLPLLAPVEVELSNCCCPRTCVSGCLRGTWPNGSVGSEISGR